LLSFWEFIKQRLQPNLITEQYKLHVVQLFQSKAYSFDNHIGGVIAAHGIDRQRQSLSQRNSSLYPCSVHEPFIVIKRLRLFRQDCLCRVEVVSDFAAGILTAGFTNVMWPF